MLGPNNIVVRDELGLATGELRAAGVTSMYVPYWVRLEAIEAMLAEAAAMKQVQGEFARGGAVKFIMDGVWESYTALNLEPYANDPDASEDGIWSLERFTQMAAVCDKLGLQIFVHACVDGAVRRILDG